MKRFFKYLCAFIVFFGFTAKAHAGIEIDLVRSDFSVLNPYACSYQNRCACHRITNAGTSYKEGRVVGGSGTNLMAYCFNHALEAPTVSNNSPARYYERKLTANEQKWANSFIYVLKNGWNGKSWNRKDKNGSKEFTNAEKYYVTQLAIWGLQGSAGVDLYKLSPYNSCNGLQANIIKAARKLYEEAKNNNKQSPLSVKISPDNTTMKLSSDGKYYQTDPMTVSGTGFNTYTVKLTSAPSGTEIYIPDNKSKIKSGSSVNKGKKVVIRIPVSQVTKNATIKIEIGVAGTYQTLKTFETKVKCYSGGRLTKCQDMGMFLNETKATKAKATINLKPTGGFEVEKVDGNGKRISGAVLAVKDSKGKVVAKWNTKDVNPKKFTGLPVGAKYTVYEVTAPKGYKKIATQTVVQIEVGKVQLKKIRNYKKTPLVVSKLDVTNKTEVPGATLAIYNKVTGAEIDRWVSKSEPHYVENIAAGRYYLKEISAPEGYIPATSVVDFSVDANGNVKLINFKFTERSSHDLVAPNQIAIYNKPYDNVPISKQDATTGKELPGATLVLKDSNGKVIDKWTSGTTPHYVKNLKSGTYTLEETIAPKGYIKTTEKVTFTVNAEGKVDKKVVMKNTPKPPVEISKQDATTGKELPGARLVLKNSLGAVVEEWTSGNIPHIVSKQLEAGTYTLSETIAPKGYQTTTEVVTFTVNEQGKVDKPVVMKNKPKTSVKISKQDITTGKELPGAQLIVKDSKGKIVDKWISKSKPHYLPVLPDGKYTLIEKKAPKGYELSEEIIEFNIKNNGVEQTVIMHNSQIPVTADIPINKIIAGIAIALVGGIAVFYKIGRQNLNAE